MVSQATLIEKQQETAQDRWQTMQADRLDAFEHRMRAAQEADKQSRKVPAKRYGVARGNNRVLPTWEATFSPDFVRLGTFRQIDVVAFDHAIAAKLTDTGIDCLNKAAREVASYVTLSCRRPAPRDVIRSIERIGRDIDHLIDLFTPGSQAKSVIETGLLTADLEAVFVLTRLGDTKSLLATLENVAEAVGKVKAAGSRPLGRPRDQGLDQLADAVLHASRTARTMPGSPVKLAKMRDLLRLLVDRIVTGTIDRNRQDGKLNDEELAAAEQALTAFADRSDAVLMEAVRNAADRVKK